MCLFQGKKNWATQASKHKIDHNSMTLNSNLYYFGNTYCWCLLPSPWTSGSEKIIVLTSGKTIDTIDSQYILLYIIKGVVFFFPWKSYYSTHSLVLEISGIFFPDPEKKNTAQKFRKFENLDKISKIMLLVTIDFEFRKITYSHPVIWFFGKNGDRGYT